MRSVLPDVVKLLAGDLVVLDRVQDDLLERDAPAGGFARDVLGEVDGEVVFAVRALGGKSAASRERDMLLKVLTHDLMVVWARVETEQVIHLFREKMNDPFIVAEQKGSRRPVHDLSVPRPLWRLLEIRG